MSEEEVQFLKPPYPVTNLGDPMSLEEMLDLMTRKRSFARFIRGKMVKALGGDVSAQDCLASYCVPADDELTSFGLPLGPLHCTEHGFLIQGLFCELK